MDAIDMNALTGKARMEGSDRSSMLFLQGHLRNRYMLFVSQTLIVNCQLLIVNC
jgi:hypothetical protein